MIQGLHRITKMERRRGSIQDVQERRVCEILHMMMTQALQELSFGFNLRR